MIESRKELRYLKPYEVPPYSRKNKIRLDLNESLFGCSPKVTKALKKLDASDISMYPEYDLLTKRIAQEFSVNKENVLLTNGGDDAIRIVIDTFLKTPGKVVIPVPTYSMFELYSELCKATIRKIKYNKDFSYPVENVLKNITYLTDIVIAVNPASPLGTLIPEKDLIRILKKSKRTIVLLDETYWHFSGVSNSKLIKKYKNLIIVQTFSKIYGLAGMRLGFILADKSLMPEIKKVAFPYAATYPAVVAGYAAIQDKHFLKGIVRKINIEKKYLIGELNKIALKTYSTKTNFILADFGLECNNVYTSLFKKGILVKNISSMPLMHGCLRITIGTRKENKILVDALKSIVKNPLRQFTKQ